VLPEVYNINSGSSESKTSGVHSVSCFANSSSKLISLGPRLIGSSVLCITNTCLTDGHFSTAASTVFLSSIVLPARTPWFAVTTTQHSAKKTVIHINHWLLLCSVCQNLVQTQSGKDCVNYAR
jgi:hypothetical protein